MIKRYQYERTYKLLLLRLISQRIATKGASGLLHVVHTLLHPFNVFQPELGLNNLHIPKRIHVALDVNDFGIIECTDNLKDAIDGANMRQEGIAKTCTGRSTLIAQFIFQSAK
jgi:hypothetical protein